MLTVNELAIAYPDQTWLEFSQTDREEALSSEGDCSNEAARWNAYLNRLCLNLLTPWLQEEAGLEEPPSVWPTPEALPSIWEVVNGTAITLEETRIVIIPSDTIDTEEFCVPQEWVDIPSWAANYYLAVQVNPLDGWLRVWGYATHRQLKQEGTYDSLDGSYSLEREDLTENLNVLWVARSLALDEKEVVKPLPTLSQTQAENLLRQLALSYSPRLDVEFEQWGALLENDTWKQQLYKRRREKVVPPSLAVTAAGAAEKRLVNLSNWFQNVFETGWQTVEELFGTKQVNFALASRSIEMETESPETIRNLIEQIYTNPDEHRRKQAASRLGEIRTDDRDAIAALIHLLRTTQDEETRWTAAESLWTIDLNNPASGVRRVKDVGMQLADETVALLVGILPKADQKVAILLRVYPIGSKTYLPPQLQLTVLDEAGDTFLEAQARELDKYIQLKFGGSRGERFSVRVALKDANLTEDFVI